MTWFVGAGMFLDQLSERAYCIVQGSRVGSIARSIRLRGSLTGKRCFPDAIMLQVHIAVDDGEVISPDAVIL